MCCLLMEYNENCVNQRNNDVSCSFLFVSSSSLGFHQIFICFKGETALHIAASNRDLQLVSLLLEHGAGPVQVSLYSFFYFLFFILFYFHFVWLTVKRKIF